MFSNTIATGAGSSERAGRPPPTLRRRLGSTSAIALCGAAFGIWQAGPVAAACTTQDDTTWVCGGLARDGIDVGVLLHNPAKVTFDGLWADIAPTDDDGPAKGNGIVWTTGSQSATLDLADPTHSIIIDAITYSAVKDRKGVSIAGASSGPFSGGLSLNIGMPVIAHSTGLPAVLIAGTGATGSEGASEPFEKGHAGNAGRAVGAVTVTGSAPVTTSGSKTPAVAIELQAGNGGVGGTSSCCSGGNGGKGGSVATTTVNTAGDGAWALTATGGTSGISPGLIVVATAGDGGRGNGGATSGGDGDSGRTGGKIVVGDGAPARFAIRTNGTQSPAMTLQSNAGAGGRGFGGGDDNGGKAGDGGVGGEIWVVIEDSTFTTKGSQSPGFVAVSQGGAGGTGGSSTFAQGMNGGIGQGGGHVKLLGTGQNVFATTGDESDAIELYSLGGIGGAGGNGGWFGPSGNGGVTGDSGKATVDLSGAAGSTITTSGANSYGINVQSIAGHGGSAGSGVGLIEFATQGGSAGAGGEILVLNAADITTRGNISTAISAVSTGGGGGHGGSGFAAFFAEGGTGGQGGAGGKVTVGNTGALTLSGNSARGIFAQSIGGVGGAGGAAGAIVGIGGKGGEASDGGAVAVTSSGAIATGFGADPGPADADEGCEVGCSPGILAQSIGGGGGAGGSSGGWFTLGGSAGGGGSGGTVSVSHETGAISTTQTVSPGILAQALGGGGGHGGAVVGGGAVLSAAIGGTGGDGGDGSAVSLGLLNGASVTTLGDSSLGIGAHSVGGGGGAGGFAVDAAAGISVPALSLAMGGSGGGGGGGGAVTVDTLGSGSTAPGDAITTAGDNATGILAQSIGGGGGHGGLDVSVGLSDVGALAIGIGGSGGSGGAGEGVTVSSGATVSTRGDHADGILAQSIGGGGGHGATSIAASISETSIGVSIGGSGGSGGAGSTVTVTGSGDAGISALGDFSNGLVAQSIGGGGGNGGMAVSGTIALGGSAALSFGLGGKGGVGGGAAAVVVSQSGPVATAGDHASGILAQSIAGGGGAGGMAISAAISTSSSSDLAFSIGGEGSKGGTSGSVSVTGGGSVTSTGDHSPGIVAQSIAGGGGAGGLAASGALSLSGSTSLGLALGGAGGTGGTAKPVGVSRSGAVSTAGLMSDAVVAQSIGGGGGAGGTAISGTISTSNSTELSVAVGGAGVSGGTAGAVSVTTTGALTAKGDGARGIVAQAIGGGGGTGGTSISGSLTTSTTTKDLSVSVGGTGGGGGAGAAVTVTASGTIATGSATDAADGLAGEHGILAQSIGGGGGSGGLAANGTANRGNRSLQVSVGGFAGTGASGAAVTVTNEADIATLGFGSHGILAQSIGGGGGEGGGTATFGATTSSAKAYSVAVGGLGGGGAGTGTVSVANDAAITAAGLGSRGIVAQGIAGGGGAGGSNLFRNQSGTNDPDQFSLGVGGFGGTGASPGGVTLTTGAGSVITTGNPDGSNAALPATADSYAGHGILLQAIGGGGGDASAGITGDVKPGTGGTGSSKSADIAIGGFGGGGGNGGNITAGTTSAPLLGSITTWDHGSHGLIAQSIGGGGGHGGAGISGDVKNNAAQGLTIGVGGFGAGAGAGRTVGIVSNADIRVAGDNSRGILAQSIGGGGGAGGTGIAGDISGASDDGTKQLDLGLGGRGAGGGNGGAVTLVNGGDISTGVGGSGSGSARAMGMDAIAAQSIGGGGGVGGAGILGNVQNSSKAQATTVTLGIALAAGGGGNGGKVSVTSTGTLSTAGNAARGILAQSIGGGGGAGGVGIEGNVSAPSDATSDRQLDLGLGGKAGGGGTGGAVTVASSSAITTTFAAAGSMSDQQGMHGILAQSIGGGGGAGGIGVAGDITGAENSKALNIAVGGAGGSGGGGGAVAVTSTGPIQVAGDGSRGIFAQSVGGGGGDASGLLNGTVDSGKGTALTVAVGASGGAGGTGGQASVANDGAIVTGSKLNSSLPTVSQAHGIFAQSIGGGGGTGRLSGGIVFGSTKDAGYERGLSMTLGAASSGGAGGTVQIQNAAGGAITTWNLHSHGIFAQSVGGGGGHASGAGHIGTEDPSDRWLVDVNLGGTASAAGDGGDVTITNDAAITTSGAGSFGILGQSVGGGGGAAGDGAGVKQQVQDVAQSTFNAVISANVGGQGGSSGGGGAIVITSTGPVITQGEGAAGIYGQSVGGGGGRGAGAAAGLPGGIVTVGGTGGTSGDGGPVTITATGDIATGKDGSGSASASTTVMQAHGIFAQSVGGGGGEAGTVLLGPETSFGSGLSMSRNGDSQTDGDGADVAVSASGRVATKGNSSVGIFAQSVGGGGGIKGETGTGLIGALIGSSGGTGTAGSVEVAYSGAGLTTTGDGAHGIFAQSAGGAGSTTSNDTKVSVTAGGDVSVAGGGAHGIYAQSVGDGMGAIAVSVGSGATVQGGGAATVAGAADGAGIYIAGGTGSTLTNAGTITSVLGANGVAVNAVDTDLSIDNSGAIVGEILKASSIRLLNRATGTIDAGPRLDVDRLTNRGTLAFGTGSVGATHLTGDLVQGTSGTLRFDLDPSRRRVADSFDRLTVGGDATLDGRLRINVLDPWQAVPGRHTLPLIRVQGNLEAGGLAVVPSVVAQYRLERPGAGTLGVSYDIDFANRGILAVTNANQDRVAAHLHDTYRLGGLDRGIALELIGIENAAEYARVMNTLGAEVSVSNQIASVLSAIRFGDALLGCADRNGDDRLLDAGRCSWLEFGRARLERQETGDNLGFDADGWRIAGGGRMDLDNGWSLGGAVAYETRSLRVNDSNASGDGGHLQFGLSAMRRFGATELSGSLALGYGELAIEREPLPGVSIDGTQPLWLASGQIRAAHLIERGRWSLRPRVDLGIDYLWMEGFDERGDAGLGLRVDGTRQAYVSVQPAIDIAGRFEAAGGILVRPSLSLGLTQFLGDAAPSVTGRLASAPRGAGSFTASTELGRTRLDIAAGVDVLTRGGAVVRAAAAGSFSEHSRDFGASLKVEIPF